MSPADAPVRLVAAQVDCETHQISGRIMVVPGGDTDQPGIRKGSNDETR